MIECYYRLCPNHIIHTVQDDGPYCNLNECVYNTLDDVPEAFKAERQAFLDENNLGSDGD